jgi:hypothetical protein
MNSGGKRVRRCLWIIEAYDEEAIVMGKMGAEFVVNERASQSEAAAVNVEKQRQGGIAAFIGFGYKDTIRESGLNGIHLSESRQNGSISEAGEQAKAEECGKKRLEQIQLDGISDAPPDGDRGREDRSRWYSRHYCCRSQL